MKTKKQENSKAVRDALALSRQALRTAKLDATSAQQEKLVDAALVAIKRAA